MAELIKCFASDNCSNVHPKIMKALEQANTGYEVSYGDDEYTEAALKSFKEVFGESSHTYFVYNGTGANTLALGSVLRPYQAVIAPYTSHISVDETGAPERYSGCKLIAVDCEDGKLTPEHIKPYLETQGVMHHSQLKIASITNPTETGALYTLDEIQKLSDFLHENDLLLHMDGARISNAAAALECTLKQITADCGVDVLSFGGTKNGMMFGEAVVFMTEEIGEDFVYIRKNGTQLHSKMRYISCQFEQYLKDNLWLENAQKANATAQYLYNSFLDVKGAQPAAKTECNSVFMKLSDELFEKLSEKYYFYQMDMDKGTKASRFMCSYSTSKEDVDALITLAKS